MYQQFRQVACGDQMVIRKINFGREPDTWSGPFDVTKVTKTQFTVNIDGNPTRFKRTDGREFGYNGTAWRAPQAYYATEEKLAEIAEERAEQEREQNERDAEQRIAELALREKYGVQGITDDDIQNRYFKPLITMAEQAENKISSTLKDFEGVSVEKGNFWRVADRMKRAVERGDMEYGERLYELSTDAIAELGEKLLAFNEGKRFVCNDKEITTAEELAQLFMRFTLDRQLDRFFNFRFTPVEIGLADQKFISELRSTMGDQYSYNRISEKKEQDDE